MNAASFFGQLSSTVLVGYLSVPVVIITATFCCSVILFGLIGVHTVVGVVIWGVLYGYFAGICMFSALDRTCRVDPRSPPRRSYQLLPCGRP